MVKVDTKDLYQMLIAECRYGYFRNNHLMPDGAYDHVSTYLDKIYEDDETFGISTAKQLLEECISDQLVRNFDDGLDDESNNRATAIGFIIYLKQWLKAHNANDIAYNEAQYLDNVAKANALRYDIVSLKPGTFEESGFDINKTIRTDIVGYGKAYDALMTDVLGTESLIVNRVPLVNDDHKVYGSKLRVCEPLEHKNELYAIVLSENN